MSDPTSDPTNNAKQAQPQAPRTPDSPLFSPSQPPASTTPVAAWGIAGLVVLVAVGLLLFASRRKATPAANTIQPLAAYAATLPLSQIAMSESTSLSGGKSTFIDGHVQNTGNQTISAITVQAIFRNDEQMPPYVETLPLALIRTHQPYVDTQPVSAAPLKPGDDREFRLIFETIPTNWNVQLPEIRIIRVETR